MIKPVKHFVMVKMVTTPLVFTQLLGGENGLLGLAERDIQKGNGGLFPLGCHTVSKLF